MSTQMFLQNMNTGFLRMYQMLYALHLSTTTTWIIRQTNQHGSSIYHTNAKTVA